MRTAHWMGGLLALASALVLAGETVDYTVAGEAYRGYRVDAEQARGTVVVLPTWNGLGDYEKDRAQMLAAQGFDAFAADLYPVGEQPKTLPAKQAAAQAHFGDAARMHAILEASIAAARQRGREPLLVMGYSMGAVTTMELAWSGLGNRLGVDGYVVFSGRFADPRGRVMPDGVAPIFLALGEADRRVDVGGLADFVDDVEMAGGSVSAHTYPGVGHLFSAFGFPNYDAEADRASWSALGAFLAEQYADGDEPEVRALSGRRAWGRPPARLSELNRRGRIEPTNPPK